MQMMLNLAAELNRTWTRDRKFVEDTPSKSGAMTWSVDVKQTDSLIDPIKAELAFSVPVISDEPRWGATLVYTWKNGKWIPLSLSWKPGNTQRWMYKNILDLVNAGKIPPEFLRMAEKAVGL
jgi:hypothetical protein